MIRFVNLSIKDMKYHQVSLRKSRIEMLEIAEQERNALEKDKQELLLGGRDGSLSFLSHGSLCQDESGLP